jgi:proliferating cell nuclear antigen
MNISITTLAKAELFAAIFQHIRVFTDSINICFDNEKMYIQSMDSSSISIFEIFLPAAWFDTYTLSNKTTIGINSTIFYRILNSREKMQTVHIEYTEENSDHLYIHFSSENTNEFNKFFEIPLIELDTDMMQIPEMDYSAEFTISSSHFSGIINQLKLFGDTMQIKCSEEKIILYSQTKESGKMSVEININDLNEFSITEGDTIKTSFSLSFLHNICLYNKIAKELEIKIMSDFPIKMIYRLDDSDARMIFYLAPKINDDGDDDDDDGDN